MTDKRLQGTLRRSPALLIGLLAPLISAPGVADPIDDASFFEGIEHTLLEFETDGRGNVINLGNGATMPMPADEYATFGLVFDPAIGWVNDASGDFDQAQAIGGSPPIAFARGQDDRFDMLFDPPLQAFGAWIVNNRSVQIKPQFDAFDSGGNFLETVRFEGVFVDGTVGIADYGFMGISSTTPIARVQVTKDAGQFDSLRFTGDIGLALFVEGSCPGRISLRVERSTPHDRVAFAYAFGEGSFTIPSGPCAGIELGLDASVALAGVARADGDGVALLEGDVPAAACGRVFVQALDVATCDTSSVQAL